MSNIGYSIIKDNIDGEDNWYYYKDSDNLWDIIKNDWLSSCREKYFKYVEQKDVMITCGAHIGMYTRFYAKEFNTVYAFEPDSFHFFCLVNNVPNNNVIKIQAAVGNDRELINLYQSGCNGHLTLSVNNKQNGIIPVFKIDDLNLPVCNLMQMDIEYYEYSALLGAIDTIKRCSPTIIAENGETLEIKALLEPLGYYVIDRTSYDTIWIKK